MYKAIARDTSVHFPQSEGDSVLLWKQGRTASISRSIGIFRLSYPFPSIYCILHGRLVSNVPKELNMAETMGRTG